jgi:serine/threonine-protein kinase
MIMGETSAAPGRRIAGYLLQERIGAGAGTQTFRAHDTATGRVAALRVVIDPVMASDPGFRDRFTAEVQAIVALDDPHIAPVYAVGTEGSVLYVATRFVFGNSLATMLRPINSSLPPLRAASLVTQVAAALDAAHAIGLVHHSVKPANILLGAYPGQPEHAYVSDFGLAKLAFDFRAAVAADSRPTAAPTLGDPDYLAPESTRDNRVDGRADQYALSCVAFRMLTGTVPFSRPTSPATLLAHLYGTVPRLSSLIPELPSAVDAVLSRAMAKDPAERYGSCGEFATALSDALPAQ